MCTAVPWVVRKGYLLWSACSLDKILLAFPLLHFVLQGQTCLLFRVSLDFLFLHSNPLWWKGHLFFFFFFGVSFRICCGLPRRFSGKESTCQYRRWKRYSFDPRIGKILWRGKWQPLKYSCLENHGQRSLAGYSPWGHTKSDTTEWLSMHTRRYSRCSLYQSVSASSVSVVLA